MPITLHRGSQWDIATAIHVIVSANNIFSANNERRYQNVAINRCIDASVPDAGQPVRGATPELFREFM
ncbi:MAG: hypothetical protein HKN47_15305 [Pirellulaceae bacterium]|nr:hypothetical protein [Pirellulaceae bacterium]